MVSKLIMKINLFISKNERSSLLIFAFAAFMFVFSVIFLDIIETIENQNSAFAIDYVRHTLGGFHLITLFIFLSLLGARKFVFSTLLTSVYFFLIFYAVRIRYEDDVILSSPNLHFFLLEEVSFIEKILTIFSTYDYIAVFFASTLLFWQISILLRMLIKTLQKDKFLP